MLMKIVGRITSHAAAAATTAGGGGGGGLCVDPSTTTTTTASQSLIKMIHPLAVRSTVRRRILQQQQRDRHEGLDFRFSNSKNGKVGRGEIVEEYAVIFAAFSQDSAFFYNLVSGKILVPTDAAAAARTCYVVLKHAQTTHTRISSYVVPIAADAIASHSRRTSPSLYPSTAAAVYISSTRLEATALCSVT